MSSTRNTSFYDIPYELRCVIWNCAFNTSSEIQTLSIFDTRLYERDTSSKAAIPSTSSTTENETIIADSHWSIVSVPKRCLPTALLTCRETWAFFKSFQFGYQQSHSLVNPASINVLKANPEKFYQSTVYSPIPKTQKKGKRFLIKSNELVHFKPFEQKIRYDPGHSLEITSQDRALKFAGIKYLAISYTDLYYFKHSLPNTIKFHSLQVLFVLKPTYEERQNNPCTKEEFEKGIKHADSWSIRYNDIYPVSRMELNELPIKIIRVENLETAARAADKISTWEADGNGLRRTTEYIAYRGARRVPRLGPTLSSLVFAVLGRRGKVDYEVNLWKNDGVGVQEIVDWDENERLGGTWRSPGGRITSWAGRTIDLPGREDLSGGSDELSELYY